LAKPPNSGVANSNSISVPCRVNSALYCSGLTNCRRGAASSARMIIASRPAMRKNPNEVARYRYPITL
jgi:hypothetical protein